MILSLTPINRTRIFSAPVTATWMYHPATDNWSLTVAQYVAYVYPVHYSSEAADPEAVQVVIEDRLTDEDVFLTLAWSLSNAFGTAETFLREELQK